MSIWGNIYPILWCAMRHLLGCNRFAFFPFIIPIILPFPTSSDLFIQLYKCFIIFCSDFKATLLGDFLTIQPAKNKMLIAVFLRSKLCYFSRGQCFHWKASV